MNNKISADFPYQSTYINVMGSQIHYIDENNLMDLGQTTFLCVHGNPSSSYLWRNVVPHLLPHGRIVALDLIGFGKSEKPDIDYKVLTHSKYFDEFVNQLRLSNIVLVLHDWGTALGLSYARRHEEKIKGIAFMEGVVKPKRWNFGNPFVRLIFRLFRTPVIGKWMIINGNFFVERILLQLGTIRTFNKQEKDFYRQPFIKKESRKPVYVFPNEIPINGKPKDVYEMVKKNHEWLQQSNIPKLLLWVKPGVLIKPRHDVEEMKNKYRNLKAEYLGKSSNFLKASHYVQEDFPNEIGKAIVKWHKDIKELRVPITI